MLFESARQKMNAYKFDFKEVIRGSVEIEAEHGVEAEEKFMEMSLKDLLSSSQHASAGTEREIRFVVTSVFDSLGAEDWNLEAEDADFKEQKILFLKNVKEMSRVNIKASSFSLSPLIPSSVSFDKLLEDPSPSAPTVLI